MSAGDGIGLRVRTYSRWSKNPKILCFVTWEGFLWGENLKYNNTDHDK